MIMICDTTLNISTPKPVPSWMKADNYAKLMEVKTSRKGFLRSLFNKRG